MKRVFAAALAAAGVAVPLWLGRVAANSAGQQKAAGGSRGDSMADDAKQQDPEAALREVEIFAMGGVGFAGTTSDGEAALRKLLEAPDSAAALRGVLEGGTPAGQLYALVGLSKVDPAAFKTEVARFTTGELADRQVQTMAGCVISTERVGDVAGRIGNRE